MFKIFTMPSTQLARVLFVVVTATFSLPAFSATAPPFDYRTAEWQTGQILAMSEPMADPFTLIFELATGSRFGHVGVVSVEDGQVFVYHSNPPGAQKSPLILFLARAVNSTGGNWKTKAEEFKAIQKLATVEEQVKLAEATLDLKDALITQLNPKDPLTDAEKISLKDAMDGFVAAKVPYNFSQYRNSSSMNCSEFVYESFKKMGRDQIGTVQKFKELNLNSTKGTTIELWQAFGGKVDLTGEVLSPASVVFSENVCVLSSNLPSDRIVSDWEIVKGWSETGGLERFALNVSQMGKTIPVSQLSKLSSHNPYTSVGVKSGTLCK